MPLYKLSSLINFLVHFLMYIIGPIINSSQQPHTFGRYDVSWAGSVGYPDLVLSRPDRNHTPCWLSAKNTCTSTLVIITHSQLIHLCVIHPNRCLCHWGQDFNFIEDNFTEHDSRGDIKGEDLLVNVYLPACCRRSSAVFIPPQLLAMDTAHEQITHRGYILCFFTTLNAICYIFLTQYLMW